MSHGIKGISSLYKVARQTEKDPKGQKVPVFAGGCANNMRFVCTENTKIALLHFL